MGRSSNERLALHTTVYPGVERFLAAWYASVIGQNDGNFDLWISVDALDVEDVVKAIGVRPDARWLPAEQGRTPAQIRQAAIEMLAARYPAIVFVDSDDLLHPRRVEAARADLAERSVVGCALRVMNESGADLGIVFGPEPGESLQALLPRYNVFGLSNTAYRSEALMRCLPIPDDCVLVDWLLATRAWSLGESLYFNKRPLMLYRQYPANTARVLPPFTPEVTLAATRRVLNHYHCILDSAWTVPAPYRDTLSEARDYVEGFHRAIAESPLRLNEYVAALNTLRPRYIWWWCVAHPDLEEIWRS